MKNLSKSEKYLNNIIPGVNSKGNLISKEIVSQLLSRTCLKGIDAIQHEGFLFSREMSFNVVGEKWSLVFYPGYIQIRLKSDNFELQSSS